MSLSGSAVRSARCRLGDDCEHPSERRGAEPSLALAVSVRAAGGDSRRVRRWRERAVWDRDGRGLWDGLVAAFLSGAVSAGRRLSLSVGCDG